jgi:preprotein translocase subunit SecG
MSILSILQIVIPFFLIICILVQQKGTALGSVFGGSGDFYSSRRGAEQKIFYITIILAVLFIAVSILNLVI